MCRDVCNLQSVSSPQALRRKNGDTEVTLERNKDQRCCTGAQAAALLDCHDVCEPHQLCCSPTCLGPLSLYLA